MLGVQRTKHGPKSENPKVKRSVLNNRDKWWVTSWFAKPGQQEHPFKIAHRTNASQIRPREGCYNSPGYPCMGMKGAPLANELGKHLTLKQTKNDAALMRNCLTCRIEPPTPLRCVFEELSNQICQPQEWDLDLVLNFEGKLERHFSIKMH